MLAAVDPGREKAGIALVDKQGVVIESTITDTDEVDSYLMLAINKYNIEKIILGDGTASSLLHERLEGIAERQGLCLQLVAERDSTREAAVLYRQRNYPLWKRVLSFFISWRPKEPIDDYAAIILARRYLEEEQ